MSDPQDDPAAPLEQPTQDTTDPLGQAQDYAEEAVPIGQDERLRLESVRVQYQGGGGSHYLRLSVREEFLADRLRAFLLTTAESLTGFRDLLAGELPLTAALEPFSFILSQLESGSAPASPRLSELRDSALWFMRLVRELGSHELWLEECHPEHLAFAQNGLGLEPRFLGWTQLRTGPGPAGWAVAAARDMLLPAARYCRRQAEASGAGFAIPAADGLIAALESPDDAILQETLLRLEPRYQLLGATDTGKRRQHNEDAWLALHLEQHSSTGVELALAAVADGMGGHAAGELASSLALDLLRGSLATSLLLPRTRPHDPASLPGAIEAAILSAAAAIAEKARLDPSVAGMGTTLAGLACMRTRSTTNPGTEAGGCVFWTGDSRVYLLDYAGLRQLSRDHSLVQTLLDSGQLDPQTAWSHPQKNVVTRCLGGGPGSDPSPDLRPFRLGPGEIAIVCSDGLSDALRDEEIAAVVTEVVRAGSGPAAPALLEDLSAALIKAANEAGGPDNISVVLMGA